MPNHVGDPRARALPESPWTHHCSGLRRQIAAQIRTNGPRRGYRFFRTMSACLHSADIDRGNRMSEWVAAVRQHRFVYLALADTLCWGAAFVVFAFARFMLSGAGAA